MLLDILVFTINPLFTIVCFVFRFIHNSKERIGFEIYFSFSVHSSFFLRFLSFTDLQTEHNKSTTSNHIYQVHFVLSQILL